MPLTVTECRSDHDSLCWDRFVQECPESTGYHLLGWRNVIGEVFGHDSMYLMVSDQGGETVAIAPLVLLSSPIFGSFLISLPFVNYGGIVANSVEAHRLLEEYVEKYAVATRVTHVELRQQEKLTTSWSESERKVSMRLPLPNSFDELWKAFPSKLRSQVRRAQKEGMTVEFGATERVDDFYRVFSRCMRDLGTPVYTKAWFRKILEVFPKESRICVVYHEETPVAAGFLYGFRTSLEIPWAASDRRFNRLSPNMLLYSSVLEFACQQGFQTFDFGRSTPDSGTYRFKEQWGAQPHQLYWYYWLRDGGAIPQLNPQNPKYRLAIRTWQCLPVWVANALGPHIVKYLP